MSGQLQASAALTTVPIGQETGWAREPPWIWRWRENKSLTLPGV